MLLANAAWWGSRCGERVLSGETCSKVRTVDRSAVRHKTFERTAVTIAGVTSTAHILNLSMTGALLHSDIPVSRSVHIFVDIAGRSISGEVVWVDKSRFGVRFDRPLAPDLITTLLR